MDNNILNLLSSLLGHSQNTTSGTSNLASSYYPSDAFPNSSQNVGMSNGLLPLLLSLMGGNNSQLTALSKILSGGDPSAIETLLKNNKKTPQVNIENNVPHDDVIL